MKIFEIFLREFKRACIFGTVGAQTQNQWVRFFLKLLERRTLMWFEGLPLEQLERPCPKHLCGNLVDKKTPILSLWR